MKLNYVYGVFFFALTCTALDPVRESLEWGATGAIGAGAYVLSVNGPFFDEPLIDGDTDKGLKDDTVPNEILVYASSGAALAIFLITPNNDERLLTRYSHGKGYIQALTVDCFLYGLIKDVVGSPRPCADARYESGFPKRSIRDSFPSGHTATAFTSATYLSLYIWNCLGDNRGSAEIISKSALSAALMCSAGWIGYTRIDDNMHRTEDVIAGAALGTAVAAGVFAFQQNALDSRGGPELTAIPDGFAILWRF